MINTIVKTELTQAEYHQIVKFIERSSFDTFKELTVHKTSDETYVMQNSVLKILRKAIDSAE